jgi:hypothetical protein
MNYSTARETAVLLYDEPLAQVTELKRIRADLYRIRLLRGRCPRFVVYSQNRIPCSVSPQVS